MTKKQNQRNHPNERDGSAVARRLEIEIVRKSIEQKNALGHLDDVRKSLRASKAIYTEKAPLDDFRTGSLFERSEKRRV